MSFEPINPVQFPKPIAPYSAGTKAGNTIYVSGTLALGEGGSVLHPDDAAAQTRHVLETIRITLEAAGASMALAMVATYPLAAVAARLRPRRTA